MRDSSLRSSTLIRVSIAAAVALLLLIPAAFVSSLIQEREQRRNDAVNEVSEKWGLAQTLTGPVLMIPFSKESKDEKGKTVVSTELLNILPERVETNGTVTPTVRYRGIYEAVLYSSSLDLKGSFVIPNLSEYAISPGQVHWNDAFITMGVSDLRGIRNNVVMEWDGVQLSAEPGVRAANVAKTGFTILPHLDPSKNRYSFAMNIRLNGSGESGWSPWEERPGQPFRHHGRVPVSREVSFRKHGRSRRMASRQHGAFSN